MIRVRSIVYGAVLSAPLMFFSFGSISAFKVFASLLLIAFVRDVIRFGRCSLFGSGPFRPLIIGFLIYSVIVQLAFGIWGAAAYGDYPSIVASKPLNRLGVQFFSFLLISVFAVYIYDFARKKPVVITRPVVVGLKLLLLVSLYELVSIYLALPKIPIYLGGEASQVNQNFSNILAPNRINSLAGEPRFYAVILAVVFNSLLFYFAHQYAKLSQQKRIGCAILLAYLLILLFYTQSTSGLIVLAVLLPLSVALSKGVSIRRKLAAASILLIGGAMIFPLVADLVQTRVVERISEEMLSDKYMESGFAAYVDVPVLGMVSVDATDATPLILLLDQPFLAITGVGYGNISTYVKPYLPDYGGYWGYGFEGIVEPNQAWLKSILSYGVLGNAFLVVLYWRFWRHYKKHSRRYNSTQLASFYTLTSVFICTYTLTSPMLILVWFLAFHAGILERAPSATLLARARRQ